METIASLYNVLNDCSLRQDGEDNDSHMGNQTKRGDLREHIMNVMQWHDIST